MKPTFQIITTNIQKLVTSIFRTKVQSSPLPCLKLNLQIGYTDHLFGSIHVTVSDSICIFTTTILPAADKYCYWSRALKPFCWISDPLFFTKALVARFIIITLSTQSAAQRESIL